jgi:hypothetical protein
MTTTEFAGKLDLRGETLTDFAPTPQGVRLCGHERIFEVLVREPRSNESPRYWSWWDERSRRFELTWHLEGALELRFPYGTRTEEKRGRGRKVRTVVDVVREIRPGEVETITRIACEGLRRERGRRAT